MIIVQTVQTDILDNTAYTDEVLADRVVARLNAQHGAGFAWTQELSVVSRVMTPAGPAFERDDYRATVQAAHWASFAGGR